MNRYLSRINVSIVIFHVSIVIFHKSIVIFYVSIVIFREFGTFSYIYISIVIVGFMHTLMITSSVAVLAQVDLFDEALLKSHFVAVIKSTLRTW